jgi:hypothetical protein
MCKKKAVDVENVVSRPFRAFFLSETPFPNSETNHLPRQARDKHENNPQITSPFFLSQLSAMTKKIAVIGPNGGCSDPELAAALARGKSTTVCKNVFLALVL